MFFNVADGITSDQGNFELFKKASVLNIVSC